MPNTLIFEPHADDAILSTSSVLLSPLKKHIITIFDAATDTPGVVDARNSSGLTFHFENLSTSHLHLRDTHWKDRKNWRWVVNRNHDDVARVYLEEHETLRNSVERSRVLSTIYLEVIDVMRKYPSLEWDLYFPMGLIHPGHYMARHLLDLLPLKRFTRVLDRMPYTYLRVFYYKDFPYSTFNYGPKLVESMILNSKFREAKIDYLVTPDRQEMKRVFKEVYPTESKILDFWNKKAWEVYDDRFFMEDRHVSNVSPTDQTDLG